MRWQAERSEVRDGGGDYAHYDGTPAALDKDVDAKPGHAGQAIGNVAGSVFAQCGDGLLVVANQIGGEMAGVIWRQHGESRNLNRDELAVDLHLWRPSGRKDEIADLFCG